ncbi:DUF4342 domain-containing protein [Leptolyngbyaceae cyanobacterium CCMR0082]|uniref:DUF4342 domain-containing protein n=2 Tax=Adonisia turfae TaxID=2950184 RepID=A0A6M0RZV4_9CYAN|nr:DUF4342 domain-containing protein [Adonisia turfae]MDV3349343.1 DUF4342 domain-containing protein [Leptothoe sp. LEGE 181152]NEZ57157.1 DUF4342 domain-containing protein [Adonisia turfae CCMR0081]NEZ61500.1 DUF4342 domain-containing protein [Adonisia turfae CCMR0082]
MSYSDPSSPNSTPPESDPETTTEEFVVNSDNLVNKVQELINESNVRRILIKNAEGRTLLEIPLTAGLVGGAVGLAFFAPLVAIASVGMLVARFTLVVERRA